MNSCQKEFKMLGSFVILGTVTTDNCEGLVLLSLLPNGSCPVLVPVKLDNGGWRDVRHVQLSRGLWPSCKTSVCRKESCLTQVALVTGCPRVVSSHYKPICPHFSLSFCSLKSLLLTICPLALCNRLLTIVMADNQRLDLCACFEKEEY